MKFPTSLDEFGECLREAEDEDLMKSRRRCHVPWADSIVLHTGRGGRLLRFFMMRPGHEMHENVIGGKWHVGIHSHRYPIKLCPVFGAIHHDVYKKSVDGTGMNLFRFTNHMDGTPPEVEFARCTRVVREARHTLFPWEECISPHGEFHTIAIDGGKPALWLVLEGQQMSNSTELFSPHSDPKPPENSYVPFDSPEEIRDHVHSFLESVGIRLR